MTQAIKDALDAKKEIERELSKALTDWSEKTGFRVEALELITTEHTVLADEFPVYQYAARVAVRL